MNALIRSISWTTQGHNGYTRAFTYTITQDVLVWDGEEITLFFPTAQPSESGMPAVQLGYVDTLAAAQARCQEHYRQEMMEELNEVLSHSALALLRTP